MNKYIIIENFNIIFLILIIDFLSFRNEFKSFNYILTQTFNYYNIIYSIKFVKRKLYNQKF